ncbi:MAG: A/G-specific adenine glycosylase [Lactobacillales bacterium]|jgi:A/G-specific adenine glycosylase|nr:A/G-specific adenine glycosylase [Lactobacillales bacterium]
MTKNKELSDALLDWFSVHGRDMPWRVKNAAHPDAYAVWISEIMLQQTTVKTVISYFNNWMTIFPDIQTLAAAKLEDVLHAWQGLGYYTRAKKIYECAQVLMKEYGGKIPAAREKLLKLPGIGPYTASSICAFAFNMPETVVDGNVIRVLARLYGIEKAVTQNDIYPIAEKLTSQKHGADYASAIMDLGATVCTPANPDCGACPWHKWCIASQKKITDKIPLIIKPAKLEKSGTLFLIYNQKGDLFIQKRPGKGLLSGLYEFPWVYDSNDLFKSEWHLQKKKVTHVFTHFKLTLSIKKTTCTTPPLSDGFFVSPADFGKFAFSTLMKKAMKLI